MKFTWNHWERGVQIGRLHVLLHPDWVVARPGVDHDETDIWIWCLGWLSISWELAR